MRVRTIAPGLPVGSEAAIPALLGWTPPGPVDRAALEAAAHGISVPRGERAWRVDAGASPPLGVRLAGGASRPLGPGRADDAATERAARALALAAPGYAVHRLAGHRLLVCGPPPFPAAALAPGLHVWPEGILPPRVLGPDTVVVGATGAAVGVARLMGARTIVPDGATGLPDSDLAAKAAAARVAIEAGAHLVAVHVGGPDEASHVRDRTAKVTSLERADRELIAPLVETVRRARGVLRVGPDHGCDPERGAHDAAPVPWVAWRAGATGDPVSGRRLTERAAAGLAPRTVPGWSHPARPPASARFDNAWSARSASPWDVAMNNSESLPTPSPADAGSGAEPLSHSDKRSSGPHRSRHATARRAA